MPAKRKMRLVSETSVPTARHLIALIAEGDRTHEQIVEACRLWLRLQRDNNFYASSDASEKNT